MQRLNFLVDDVGASHLAYSLLTHLNVMVRERQDICPTVFYSNLTDQCVKPVEFNMMQMIEAFDQEGPTVATSIPTAGRLITMPRPMPKLYYVWDLEWQKYGNFQWSSLQRILGSPDLTLLARSESHKTAIESCFDVQVHSIIEDFDLEQILEVINGFFQTTT
jgi:hypothetical protein